jgi:hypothetical protein
MSKEIGALRMPLRLAIAVVAVAGFGCASENGPNPETCGSRTAQGSYYDFRTNSCVKPQTSEELSFVYAYAQIYRLARAGNKVIPFELTFAHALSIAQVDDQLADLSAESVSQMQLSFPEVIGGFHSLVDIDPPAAGVTEGLYAARVKLLARYLSPHLPIEQDIADGLASSFDTEHVEVKAMRLNAKPSDVLTWWRAHAEVIAQAMPLESSIPWPHQLEGFAP